MADMGTALTASSSMFSTQTVKFVCASLCTIPLAIVAISLGRIFSSLMMAMSTNPTIIEKGQSLVLIAAALTETIGLLILVIALLILFA